MKTKIWISSTVVVMMVVLALSVSCSKNVRGSGVAATEMRSMEPFTKIYAAGSGTLVLTIADEYSVRVESEKNLLPHLSTAVINGQLTIQPLEAITPTKPIVYYVSLKKLEELHLSGAFDVLNESPLHFDKLKVDIAGVCRLKLDHISGNLLEVSLLGASSMRVKGVVVRQRVDLSGAAEYEALELPSDEAEVQISGAGESSLDVKNRLKVDITGAGLVRYKGSPTISSDISGAGTIERL